jgi:hypothetical protein
MRHWHDNKQQRTDKGTFLDHNDDYGRSPTPNLYKDEQRRLLVARQRQQPVSR